MLHSYTSDTFPTSHVPTVFDNYSARCWVNGEPLDLSLWDVAGQEDYSTLRPLAYPGAHCFVVVCSADSMTSVSSMVDRWLVEIKHHNPDVPFVLCCNKVDLLDPSKAEMAGVSVPDGFSVESARKVLKEAQKHSQAQRGCSGFFACSALTQENLKSIFDTAIRVGLAYQRGELQPAPPSKPARICTIL